MRRAVLPLLFVISLGTVLITTLFAYPDVSRASGSPSAMAGMRMDSHQTSRVAPVYRLHQRTVRVTISNFAFMPTWIVVSPGTRVVWTNRDSDPHTVTSFTGVWTSAAIDTDTIFARLFRLGGTFNYYCKIHPFMHGRVTVKA